jgi:hypothetical protein
VVQALIELTQQNKADLFIVSGDKPFQDACCECAMLHAKATLTEVLDHVASDDNSWPNLCGPKCLTKLT